MNANPSRGNIGVRGTFLAHRIDLPCNRCRRHAAAENHDAGGPRRPTGFVQLEAESFRALTPRQQALAYWLTQASIAIDPIIYDQNSRFGLRQKRLLEEIVRHAGPVPRMRAKIVDFTKLFWANRGNHNDMTAQKFLPEFTLRGTQGRGRAATLAAGGFTGRRLWPPTIRNQADLDRELEALRPSLFDPDFEPMITAKSPRGKLDILQASANNFYSGVSMADLKNFHDTHPLNSRLVKTDRQAGGRGLARRHARRQRSRRACYAPFLKKANEYLEKARALRRARPGAACSPP